MPYVLTPVVCSCIGDDEAWMPGTYDTITVSIWIHRPTTGLRQLAAATNDDISGGFVLSLGASTLQLGYGEADSSNEQLVAWELGTQVPGQWENFIVSWNSNTLSGSAWYNGTSLGAPSDMPTMPISMGMSVGPFQCGGTDICQGDFWVGTGAGDSSNFISGSGFPLDLGADGELTGLSPQVYCSVRPGGVASDYLNNRGASGGTFTAFNGIIGLCPDAPPEPPSPPPPPVPLVKPARVLPGSLVVRNLQGFYVGACCNGAGFVTPQFPTAGGTR